MKNVVLPDGTMETVRDFDDVMDIIREKCGREIATLAEIGDPARWEHIAGLLDIIDEAERTVYHLVIDIEKTKTENVNKEEINALRKGIMKSVQEDLPTVLHKLYEASTGLYQSFPDVPDYGW